MHAAFIIYILYVHPEVRTTYAVYPEVKIGNKIAVHPAVKTEISGETEMTEKMEMT